MTITEQRQQYGIATTPALATSLDRLAAHGFRYPMSRDQALRLRQELIDTANDADRAVELIDTELMRAAKS